MAKISLSIIRPTKTIVYLSDSTGNIARVTMPDARIADNNYYFTVNNDNINGAVTWMKEFRDNIYLGIPSQYKVIVINKFSFKKVGQFDFSVSQRIPTDMAFVNATNGYIAHENDSTISLVDLYTFTVARSVPSGKNPIAVAAIEQQVFVACKGDNTVCRIDSRTNSIVARYSTPPMPALLNNIQDDNVAAEKRRLLLVCQGNDAQPASVSLMDINGGITGTQNINLAGARKFHVRLP